MWQIKNILQPHEKRKRQKAKAKNSYIFMPEIISE
jgi:hypothetical protein